MKVPSPSCCLVCQSLTFEPISECRVSRVFIDDFRYLAVCAVCGGTHLAISSERNRTGTLKVKDGTPFQWELDPAQLKHLWSSTMFDADAENPVVWLRQDPGPEPVQEDPAPVQPQDGCIPGDLPMIGPGTLSLLTDYGVATRIDLLLNQSRLTRIPTIGHAKASILLG